MFGINPDIFGLWSAWLSQGRQISRWQSQCMFNSPVIRVILAKDYVPFHPPGRVRNQEEH